MPPCRHVCMCEIHNRFIVMVCKSSYTLSYRLRTSTPVCSPKRLLQETPRACKRRRRKKEKEARGRHAARSCACAVRCAPCAAHSHPRHFAPWLRGRRRTAARRRWPLAGPLIPAPRRACAHDGSRFFKAYWPPSIHTYAPENSAADIVTYCRYKQSHSATAPPR